MIRQWQIILGAGLLTFVLTDNIHWSLGVVSCFLLLFGFVTEKKKSYHCLTTENLMFLFHNPCGFVEFNDTKISVEPGSLNRMRFIFNNSFSEN